MIESVVPTKPLPAVHTQARRSRSRSRPTGAPDANPTTNMPYRAWGEARLVVCSNACPVEAFDEAWFARVRLT